MDLKQVYDLLDFFINKEQGVYYTYAQKDLIVDAAQMSLFNDYFEVYLKSQRIDDALAPFYKKFIFTLSTTPGGLITVPDDYFHASAIQVVLQDGNGVNKTRAAIKISPDELAGRLNSQIFPPTTLDPIYITTQNWNPQLFPQQPTAGYMYYIARPAAPFFDYTTTGRKINYNQAGSTQLEWSSKDILSIILKTLKAIGINQREQDVMNWSQQQDQENILSANKS